MCPDRFHKHNLTDETTGIYLMKVFEDNTVNTV